MERAGIKTRDIQFWSKKNACMICVHTRQARDYAKYLEEQAWVESYEVNVRLDLERFSHISPVDIRSDYLQTDWTSDFFIHYADGRKGVRELVQKAGLQKRAVVEQLELSRRYWQALDVDEWQVVLLEGR